MCVKTLRPIFKPNGALGGKDMHTLLLPPQRGFSGTMIIEKHYIIYL